MAQQRPTRAGGADGAVEYYVPSVACTPVAGFRLRPPGADRRRWRPPVRELELSPSLSAPTSPAFGGASSCRGPILPGQILLPSWGRANDTARLHNAGKPLPADVLESVCAASLHGMSISSSAPSLLSPTMSTMELADGSPRQRRGGGLSTPRSLRKTVRSASRVELDYPRFSLPPSPEPSVFSLPEKRPRVPSHFVKGPIPPRRPFCTDKRSPQLVRSQQLLDRLYELRRENGDGARSPSPGAEPQSPAQDPALGATLKLPAPGGGGAKSPGGAKERSPSKGKAAPAEEQYEDSRLLVVVLRDLEDTYEHLDAVEQGIDMKQDGLEDLGGTRHPTVVIAMRTQQVVNRKKGLLFEVEDRLAKFEAAHARKESIVKGILGGTCEMPDELLGVFPFLKARTHSPGEPVDADRSDFVAFVQSFGLSKKHKTLKRFSDTAVAASKEWAQEALKAAQDGASTDAIKRLIDAATNMSGGRKMPQELSEACALRWDLIAKQVLELAEKAKKKDAQLVASSDKPQPESARRAGDEINAALSSAAGEGVSTKHPCMQAAKAIAVEMNLAEKTRIAQKGLRFAEAQLAKDATMAEKYEKKGEVPPVGPASTMAETVDKEIAACIKDGAVPTDPSIEKAKEIAKQLRDLDGTRKRLAARQKRLSQKAS